MLLQQALKKCEVDYRALEEYVRTECCTRVVGSGGTGGGTETVSLSKLTTFEDVGGGGTERPEDAIVGKFVLTMHPSEDLWVIADCVQIEFTVTGVYPADPPNVRLVKEPSARSLIGRTNVGGLPSIDGDGCFTSKLLSKNGWSRAYGFCPVFHDVRRVFEVPYAELLDGAVFQRWQEPLPGRNRRFWKTTMASFELQGKRRTMEDQVSLVGDVLPGQVAGGSVVVEPPLRFAGVFDGHGGAHCAEQMSLALPDELGRLIHRGARPPKALFNAFVKCDQRFLQGSAADASGSTCSCVLIGGRGRCLVGNVGDSRTILCRSGKAHELTHDHKASGPREVCTTVAMGGFVSNNRLMGQLAVGRALGDRVFKKDAVLSCEPDVRFCRLAPGDEFFLLACDGLFDVCTSQDAVDFAREKLNDGVEAKTVCKLLGEHAIELGSKDNVSVALVVLSETDGDAELYRVPERKARAAGAMDVGPPDEPAQPASSTVSSAGGNASLSLLANWDGPSDSDIKEMEDLMNEAMSSPQKGRGAAAPADSPNKSPEGNANNGLLGLDEDTLAFLMDSKNFE